MSVLTPLAAVIAAEDALPPPTEVQDTPEARETVTPPTHDDASVSEALSTKDRKDVEVHVIKRKNGATVEEYSLHGRVFMVKVIPVVGPAYYLYDSDGDGTFERRLPGGYRHIAPPEWVIKRF